MLNGGSDCCGTCWFNRSNGGERGSVNFNRDIPSYCANHPHHRPDRDPIPIGPVYVHGGSDGREFWHPSPDTEDVRQHLLDIVRAPEEGTTGYPFFSLSPHLRAIEQLVEFGDERMVEALEDLAQRDEVKEARADLLELIQTVRERLTL